MTPLLAASVTGHMHIVEYLIANDDLVSRQERIDALELLGATFVDKKRDMLGSYKLWKRAMEERYYDYYCTAASWILCNTKLCGILLNHLVKKVATHGAKILSMWACRTC